ncbi:flavodoxin domain-containing protein [Actinokineospora globicatena]|uniref:flavodoxin domain-containing protein n=1 Tax=Actinokineospora globicatena TaxID=103729 RepID=UPI0020A3EE7D|nr:flavodoxin domain-containing protein [Actinokineospora globicatena]MCP2306152.1 menaquinone-dependent protoporphyrinogen oxidase [Actinokineospora globicatena]GLW79974.1 flavodoxin [Actinokineospora globicatena]GLW86803.1 flavodoxin [Actinokineospora globicatena]
MRVLVGYATAAGSTGGVARRIAETLREQGYDVAVSDIAEAPDARGFDAVVLGSAVHGGAWLPRATAFLSRESQVLSSRPVWLFSVGLPGAFRGPMRRWAHREEAGVLARLPDAARARGHRLFTGVVTAEGLGKLGARLFRAMGGRFGDHRDWRAIDAWARRIGADMRRGGAPG